MHFFPESMSYFMWAVYLFLAIQLFILLNCRLSYYEAICNWKVQYNVSLIHQLKVMVSTDVKLKFDTRMGIRS